jgi:hypothetical protein
MGREHHDLYSLPDTVNFIQSRSLRRTKRGCGTWEMHINCGPETSGEENTWYT